MENARDCYSSSEDESLSDYQQMGSNETEVYHKLAWVFDCEEDPECGYFRYITRFLSGNSDHLSGSQKGSIAFFSFSAFPCDLVARAST